ncbi:MAG: hypothetical protein QIT36_gp024 [Methanophagales virus GBV301]|uniref:Uncharacterized protein n=1 Tax=Methanophagales virus GBV301 TaxID=2999280 RepID=A0A9E8VBF4_9CAUD|nr:MAG: hypothetical protein QIT36_gp024 [Methanophagales virus GBV301]WAE39448.1 MAG: hypothetical protein LDLAKGPJ_00024 [Methanophagales virus GBV301]
MALYNSSDERCEVIGMKVDLEKVSAAIGTVITSKEKTSSAKKLANSILSRLKKTNPTIARAALLLCLEELTNDLDIETKNDAIDNFLEELIEELFEEDEALDELFTFDDIPNVTPPSNSTPKPDPMYR